MTRAHLKQSNVEQNIKTELAASAAAATAGNAEAADAHWRKYVGLLELQMGRTGSVERLTFRPWVYCLTQHDCALMDRCLNNCQSVKP